MKIIEINALSNGAHRNQDGSFSSVPEGWAVIPEDMEIPSTFPFVDIVVNDGIVTEITANEEAYEEAMKQAEEKNTEPENEPVTWDTLAAAYTEGVNSIDE